MSARSRQMIASTCLLHRSVSALSRCARPIDPIGTSEVEQRSFCSREDQALAYRLPTMG